MKYLPHLSDPFRRSIAEGYVRHELRKLFPRLRDEKSWKNIDSEIPKWFNSTPNFAPVRDFWNGVHGISLGFKLKTITPWLTSLNLDWSKRTVSISELTLGSPLDEYQKKSGDMTTAGLRQWYFDPKHSKELKAELKLHAKHSSEAMPRDHFPVIAIRRDGLLKVMDGNRRLHRAILMGKENILAVTGEVVDSTKPILFENWVPTSSLLELASYHRYAYQLGTKLTQQIAATIAFILKDSSAGRYEFIARSVSTSRKEDQKLIQAVQKKLKEFGTSLPRV